MVTIMAAFPTRQTEEFHGFMFPVKYHAQTLNILSSK